jgi:hypothetical protein
MWLRYGTSMLLTLLCQLLAVQGERRSLDPPELIEFRPSEHFGQEYAEALRAVAELIPLCRSARLQVEYEILMGTLDQERLIDAAERLRQEADGCRAELSKIGHARDLAKELDEAVNSVDRLARSGRYLVPGGVPVEFSVDLERRFYTVRWRQWEGTVWEGSWSGQEETRTVPFVPIVTAWVKARYNADAKSYGFEVVNDSTSEATLGRFQLDAEGLTESRVEEIQVALTGRLSCLLKAHLEGGRLLHVSLPGSDFRQSFHFARFGPDRMLELAEPGVSTNYPALLRVPWPNLPGIVRCWVEVWLYHPGLDVHTDPENVTRIFARGYTVTTELGPKSLPRFMYHGKTIGPIPVPQPGDRSEFAERIRGYFQEARDWGWVPDDAWAEEMAKELANLDPTEPDPSPILRLVEEAEVAYASERLLHEAHALLKYNLEYLAEPDNWASEE